MRRSCRKAQTRIDGPESPVPVPRPQEQYGRQHLRPGRPRRCPARWVLGPTTQGYCCMDPAEQGSWGIICCMLRTITTPMVRGLSFLRAQLAQRQRDKFVPLPTSESGMLGGPDTEDLEDTSQDTAPAGWEAGALPVSPFAAYAEDASGIIGQTPAATTSRGRITVYCVAEALDRKALTALVKSTHSSQVTGGPKAVCCAGPRVYNAVPPSLLCSPYTRTLASFI